MVLYQGRMCQCGLHAVPWSHIGVLMRCLTAGPRSTAGLLFPSQCPSGTFLLTPYLMVWDWPVSRAGPLFFYWLKLLYPYYCILLFFCSLHSVYRMKTLSFFIRASGWYCGAGVFGLIGCTSLSLSLALPTSFNNYYYYYNSLLHQWTKR